MKTLEEHNKQARKETENNLKDILSMKTGVKCELCGSELHFLHQSLVFHIANPRRWVVCINENCKGFKDRKQMFLKPFSTV